MYQEKRKKKQAPKTLPQFRTTTQQYVQRRQPGA
jgi:hypothetical protein